MEPFDGSASARRGPSRGADRGPRCRSRRASCSARGGRSPRTSLVAPACLLLGRQEAFVACALASWILTLSTGAIAYARRDALGCTRWQVAGTTLIALVCLPCGGNLARALASTRKGIVSLPAWIETLPGEARATGRDALRAELEYESTWLDDDSPRRPAVASVLQSLRRPDA